MAVLPVFNLLSAEMTDSVILMSGPCSKGVLRQLPPHCALSVASVTLPAPLIGTERERSSRPCTFHQNRLACILSVYDMAQF